MKKVILGLVAFTSLSAHAELNYEFNHDLYVQSYASAPSAEACVSKLADQMVKYEAVGTASSWKVTLGHSEHIVSKFSYFKEEPFNTQSGLLQHFDANLSGSISLSSHRTIPMNAVASIDIKERIDNIGNIIPGQIDCRLTPAMLVSEDCTHFEPDGSGWNNDCGYRYGLTIKRASDDLTVLDHPFNGRAVEIGGTKWIKVFDQEDAHFDIALDSSTQVPGALFARTQPASASATACVNNIMKQVLKTGLASVFPNSKFAIYANDDVSEPKQMVSEEARSVDFTGGVRTPSQEKFKLSVSSEFSLSKRQTPNGDFTDCSIQQEQIQVLITNQTTQAQLRVVVYTKK